MHTKGRNEMFIMHLIPLLMVSFAVSSSGHFGCSPNALEYLL